MCISTWRPGCAWAESAAASPWRGRKKAGAECDGDGPGRVPGRQDASGAGGGGGGVERARGRCSGAEPCPPA